jgi:hypothetical protein
VFSLLPSALLAFAIHGMRLLPTQAVLLLVGVTAANVAIGIKHF